MAPVNDLPAGPDDSVRRRIVLATLRLIADEGLDEVRHRRVADLAGVSLGSTSYHFASRDELVREAFRTYLDEATDFLDGVRAAADRKEDPVEALVELVVELLRREFLDPTLVLAEYELLLYAARHDDLAEALRAWERQQRDELARRLRAAGAPRPTEGARTLMALVRGIEVEHLVHGPRSWGGLRRRVAPIVGSLLG